MSPRWRCRRLVTHHTVHNPKRPGYNFTTTQRKRTVLSRETVVVNLPHILVDVTLVVVVVKRLYTEPVSNVATSSLRWTDDLHNLTFFQTVIPEIDNFTSLKPSLLSSLPRHWVGALNPRQLIFLHFISLK